MGVAFVPNPIRPHQPGDPGRIEAAVLDPAAHEHVLVADAEGAFGPCRIAGDRQHFVTQIGWRHLVSVRRIDPWIFVLDFLQSVGALARFRIVRPLIDAGPCCLRNLDRPVGAEGIQHNNVIAPSQ